MRSIFSPLGIAASLAAGLLAIALAVRAGAAGEPDSRVGLTSEERQWMEAHPVWRAVGSASPPFGWIDDQGRFQGMGADYARLLETRLGIRIVATPAASWSASLEQLRQRECDISLLTVQTPERDVFLDFTDPLIDLPIALITRVDNHSIKGLSDLSGRKVAVARNWPEHEWLVENHPEIVIAPHEDIAGALSSVALGDREAFVGNLAAASYALERLGVSNLKVVGRIPGAPGRIAVRRDWPEAVAILNKAIRTIGEDEHSTIRRKWIALRGDGIPLRKVLLIAAPVAGAIIILTLLVANRALRREVARRRKVDEALKASEERWSFALEGSRDGVWDWNVQTNEVFFSKQLKAMLGFEEHELENRLEEWMNRVHTDDFARVIDEVQGHLRGEDRAYQVEHRVRCKNGEYRWILARGRIVSHDAEGKPLRMVGTHTDVTTRHATEDMLRESEQRYREIFDHTSDPIFTVEVQESGEFRYSAFNPANARFLGRLPRELSGTSVEDAMPTGTVEAVKANYRRCLAAGTSISFEEQLDFPSGKRFFHTTLVPVRDADGTIRRIIGIAHDITERKRAEEEERRHQESLEELVAARTAELAESEARFRALAELVPNHVWSANPDGRLDYVNAQAVEYFARSVEELIGDGWQAIIHPDDLPETTRLWMLSLQTGDPLELEYRMLRKDGAYRWHICQARAMRDDANRIVKWFGTTTEIEEHKAIERALHDARAAAEETARAKSSFLAHMSHEIRTPMNAVLGFTQLLLRDETLGTSQRQKLEMARRSGEHLLTLINSVLEMSKIEAGHAAAQPEVFDLPAMLSDLETMFKMRAEAKRLQFVFAQAGELPRFVKADPGKLRQALINLIGNAVKFTERGGVAVRAGTEQRGGLRLIVEVEDTGPGIAEEDRDRLFRRFEQTSVGHGVQGGTGLGLAISREFARLMGGGISVRSQVGHGSAFRLEVAIEICANPPTPAVIERRVIGLRPGVTPPRALIADDAYENRELLFEMLRMVGFETRQAVDGAEAIAEFETWSPHVILMDLRMPVLDGFEAIRRIRTMPGGSDVQIIAVSASVFTEEREKVLAGGADRFLQKPFRHEDLFEHLRATTGVEYLFAEDSPAPEPPPLTPWLDIAAVSSALPADLRGRLHEAVVHADLDRMLALLEEAARHDVRIAGELRRRAEAFEYQSLLELLAIA